MNPRAAHQVDPIDATDDNGNGSFLRYAKMPWDGIAKAAVVMSFKHGPWVTLVCGLLGIGCYFADRVVKNQETATASQNQLTAVYRESIESSKRSDQSLVESIVLMTRNLDVQTQRLDHQELMLTELRKQGTEPAREMLTLMRSANELMSDVPASRKRTEALLQRIAEKP